VRYRQARSKLFSESCVVEYLTAADEEACWQLFESRTVYELLSETALKQLFVTWLLQSKHPDKWSLLQVTDLELTPQQFANVTLEAAVPLMRVVSSSQLSGLMQRYSEVCKDEDAFYFVTSVYPELAPLWQVQGATYSDVLEACSQATRLENVRVSMKTAEKLFPEFPQISRDIAERCFYAEVLRTKSASDSSAVAADVLNLVQYLSDEQTQTLTSLLKRSLFPREVETLLGKLLRD
jgi:hypothetical protein